jgi:uracil DNA glycosylase
LKVNIEKSWLKLLDSEFNKKYFLELIDFIDKEYNSKDCYPQKKLIFSAFNKCDFNDIKVVIIGQDPYPGICRKTQVPFANGLAFSVNKECSIPASLRNMYKELKYEDYFTQGINNTVLQMGIGKDNENTFDLPENHQDYGKNVAAYYFFLFPNMMVNC